MFGSKSLRSRPVLLNFLEQDKHPWPSATQVKFRSERRLSLVVSTVFGASARFISATFVIFGYRFFYLSLTRVLSDGIVTNLDAAARRERRWSCSVCEDVGGKQENQGGDAVTLVAPPGTR